MGNIPNKWPINVRSQDHQPGRRGCEADGVLLVHRALLGFTEVHVPGARPARPVLESSDGKPGPGTTENYVKKYNWLVVEPIYGNKNNIPLVGHILLI